MKTPLEIALEALENCRRHSSICGYDSGDSAIVEIVDKAMAEIKELTNGSV